MNNQIRTALTTLGFAGLFCGIMLCARRTQITKPPTFLLHSRLATGSCLTPVLGPLTESTRHHTDAKSSHRRICAGRGVHSEERKRRPIQALFPLLRQALFPGRDLVRRRARWLCAAYDSSGARISGVASGTKTYLRSDALTITHSNTYSCTDPRCIVMQNGSMPSFKRVVFSVAVAAYASAQTTVFEGQSAIVLSNDRVSVTVLSGRVTLASVTLASEPRAPNPLWNPSRLARETGG